MTINESVENYLENILVLKKTQGKVRSVDIANRLNYKKSSISAAMKKLRINGYITVESGGFINLTEKGMEIAEKIFYRHSTIKQFLISIGVSEKTAKEDACKIEHIVSDETIEKIINQIQK